MIVVSGANGKLGGAVVDRLLNRVPADQIGASVRDPASAEGLRERGVRVRRGDFADPARLVEAFEGATRVLIVSVNAAGAEAARMHAVAIDAAVAAGAERVVYTSHMGSDPGSAFPPMIDHAATEKALEASGVGCTSLRNGFYASFAGQLVAGAIESGELVAPADGPIAWTSHADLAEAAAIALTTDQLDGPTPPLTGPEALDLERLAEIASEVVGREIRRVIVSEEEFRSRNSERGVPEPATEMLVGLFAASRDGAFAPADPALAKLIGREPESVRVALEASRA